MKDIDSKIAAATQRQQTLRERLRKSLEAEASADRMAQTFQELAEADGEYFVYASAKSHAAHYTPESFALMLLLKGTDDRWSGRTNDTRRAFQDGVVKALNNLQH